MQAYVGNGTRQIKAFMYWIPGVGAKKLVTQHIGIGNQVRLVEGVGQAELDEIILRNHKYGMRHVNEIGGNSFIGLIYSTDKPISQGNLRKLMDHNFRVMVERGKRQRSEAAVLNSQIMENSISEQRRPETLKSMNVSMQEDFNPNLAREDEPMSEGYHVSRTGDLPGLPPRETKRAARARMRDAA